jgi:beta-1,4-mannosyl-glycoprotein beta-1,4-N-acetylglucosaminyltransferase
MLVDAFMFYNELDVLELRLELLDRYVDRFVLVEAEVNHVGGPKDLFFQKNRERFAKWLPKIKHVIVTAEEAPKDPDPWAREKYQRNCILRGLEDVPSDAIVMVSDLDEIPDLTRIPFENLPHLFTTVHMWMFEYSFDYIFTGEPWFGTVITTCELFRRAGPNYLRDHRWKFPVFKFSGWHLSSFGSAMHVWNKMRTYAHGKDPLRAKETPEMFEEYVTKGIHLDGETALVPRPPEVPLPASEEILRRIGFQFCPQS